MNNYVVEKSFLSSFLDVLALVVLLVIIIFITRLYILFTKYLKFKIKYLQSKIDENINTN